MDKEKIRLDFKPKNIKVLFIGESSSHGEKFFYCFNSNLYRAVKNAFAAEYGPFDGDEYFLRLFKEKGFFLDDLCQYPINHLPMPIRKAERQHGIEGLAQRLKQFRPNMVIITMKAIENQVMSAIGQSDIQTIIRIVPFPAGSEANRLNCIKGIQEAVAVAQTLQIVS